MPATATIASASQGVPLPEDPMQASYSEIGEHDRAASEYLGRDHCLARHRQVGRAAGNDSDRSARIRQRPEHDRLAAVIDPGARQTLAALGARDGVAAGRQYRTVGMRPG